MRSDRLVLRNRGYSNALRSPAAQNGFSDGLAPLSVADLRTVYNNILYDWPQLVLESGNPIETAVALLDDTSVGMAHKYGAFCDLQTETEHALRTVVKEQHELFNGCIGQYHQLLSTLESSESDTAEIREILTTTSRESRDRLDVLKELNSSLARYAEMLDILDAAQQVSSIPRQIEHLSSHKGIHLIYYAIDHGYKLAERYQLWSLPAMQSTQIFLDTQSANLFDMLVEELQNEIYLKLTTTSSTAPIYTIGSLVLSSNPRWTSLKVLLSRLPSLEQYIHNSANLDINELANAFTAPVQEFLETQLPSLHAEQQAQQRSESQLYHDLRGPDSVALLEAALSQYADSFNYMYMLLNTASKLNKLTQVVEILESTTQLEIHGVITKSIEDCKLKNSKQLKKLEKLSNFDSPHVSDVIGNDNLSDTTVVILQELFGTIFAKVLAVIQRHKIVGDIVHLLQENTDAAKLNVNLPLENSWKTIVRELDALVVSYIHDMSFGSEPHLETATSGLHVRQMYETLRKTDVFKFEDVGLDSSVSTAEDLQASLQSMFPGLSLADRLRAGERTLVDSSPYIKNERFNTMVEVLVPRNLFNMRVILEFFLIFIAGAQNLFCDFGRDPLNNTAIDFFQTFMRDNFLAQVKDGIHQQFRDYVTSSSSRDDGSVHPGASVDSPAGVKLTVSPLDHAEDGNVSRTMQVYQNAIDFRRILIRICSILNTSLVYRKNFSSIVLKVMRDFADAYDNLYEQVLQAGGSLAVEYNLLIDAPAKQALRLSKMMTLPVLVNLSGQILLAVATGVPMTSLAEIIARETEVLLYGGLDDHSSLWGVTKDDLLDNDSFDHICYLLATALWLLTWIPTLRKESNYSVYNEEDTRLLTVDKLRYDWVFLENGRVGAHNPTRHTLRELVVGDIHLALDLSKIGEFDAVVRQFELIRDHTLLALRYDLRCKCMYYISASFAQKDWLPKNEPADADEFVVFLNKEVFLVDAKLSKLVLDQEKETIFAGLSQILNDILIQGSRLITAINANGIKRALLNIFRLQQMLRNIVANPNTIDFSRLSAYFEMFMLSEFEFIQQMKPDLSIHSIEEYLEMARLMYSERLAARDVTSLSKNNYQDFIRKIERAAKNEA